MSDKVKIALNIKNGVPNAVLTVEAFPDYIKPDTEYKKGDKLGDYIATGKRLIMKNAKGEVAIDGPIVEVGTSMENQFSQLKNFNF